MCISYSLDFTLSLRARKMFSENHSALRQDLAQGLAIFDPGLRRVDLICFLIKTSSGHWKLRCDDLHKWTFCQVTD